MSLINNIECIKSSATNPKVLLSRDPISISNTIVLLLDLKCDSFSDGSFFFIIGTDIGDTIMYCYQILRENLLNLLLSHLDAAVSKATENHAAYWPYLEACLFAWAAIGESLAEEEECPQLSQFLSKLVTIPYNDNVKVVLSFLPAAKPAGAMDDNQCSSGKN